MNFRQFLKENTVYLDGGMGTLLQKKGLPAGEKPERWNVSRPEIIKDIHKDYFNAGSNVVCANTFGANILKFSESELEQIISSAIELAKKAQIESTNPSEKFVALDIGPTGKLLKPLGDLDFEDAVGIFAKTVSLGVKYGADLIFIETMNDSLETKAAVLAAKENSDLPVLVSNAYGEDGKLMTGASPEAMAIMLEGLGADAVGANCSLGPKMLSDVAKRLISVCSLPVILKPNAGLPRIENGFTVYDVAQDEFAEEMAKLMKLGVCVMGGCCGTTPEYIKALYELTKDIKPISVRDKEITAVSSYTHAVIFSEKPILIGERINPTGKKRLKAALCDGDMNYILGEAVGQQEKGADILDVNVGLPEINEKELLKDAVCEIQAVCNLPLQIDTADPDAMERALRIYNGKAMINSVNGKKESMEAVFPLVKKYGGLVVALTLDENGIPKDADGRFEIAKKILKTAESFGISGKDIIFDTLAMTVSADETAPSATLCALKRIKNELGCHTSLGVSNISFGLPCRDAVNGVFFALALESGLSAAIMNPFSAEMMKTYHCYNLLKGFDSGCKEYIKNAENFTLTSSAEQVKNQTDENADGLFGAIVKGFKEKAAEITKKLVCEKAPLDIVNEDIIPALDKVGIGFENKTVYLPSLLMSAEAAQAAFAVIKEKMPKGENAKSKGVFVIATVKGDIHDIGKNIVKLLLENYGFKVIDLGKDVPPEKVLEAVEKYRAPFAGLSALMTTTVPAMEETVSLLKEKAPYCKVIVGGAVLTKEYAEKTGADWYAKDALDTVRFAENNV